MTISTNKSRDFRRQQKAQCLFYVYQQMGPGRSLKSLCELCAKLGLKIAESTLKNYSTDFEWQKQILMFSAS